MIFIAEKVKFLGFDKKKLKSSNTNCFINMSHCNRLEDKKELEILNTNVLGKIKYGSRFAM